MGTIRKKGRRKNQGPRGKIGRKQRRKRMIYDFLLF
jgi:hypothetical protein